MTTRSVVFNHVSAAQVEAWLNDPLILHIEAEPTEDGFFDCRLVIEIPGCAP